LQHFQGNVDNTTKRYEKFKGSRILRYLHFAILGGVGERWCLKLELFGCEWKNKGYLLLVVIIFCLYIAQNVWWAYSKNALKIK
jgi:hypothetical protein